MNTKDTANEIANIRHCVDNIAGLVANVIELTRNIIDRLDGLSAPVQKKPRVRKPHGRTCVGDIGFEDAPNPARQAAGRIGGTSRVSNTRVVYSRRENGSVDFRNLSVCGKRLYWRWQKECARARKAGNAAPSYEEWNAKRV